MRKQCEVFQNVNLSKRFNIPVVYDGQVAQLSFDFRISGMSNGVEEDKKAETS